MNKEDLEAIKALLIEIIENDLTYYDYLSREHACIYCNGDQIGDLFQHEPNCIALEARRLNDKLIKTE